MLDIITQGADVLFSPFYHLGVAIWDIMLALIGLNAVQTPVSFSSETWNYICNDLYPWTSAIGATILNISFYIGFVRQSNNLKQNITLEVFVECCIKVVIGNALMVSGLLLMRLLFEIASGLAGNILLETPVIFAQEDTDVGSAVFYAFFGIIFFVICIVCSGIIFLTIYGRYSQLYLLAGTAPIALGTLPGGPGMSQTAYAWIRTFLAKVFEIVLIVIAIVIASKMCNSIDFGSLEGVAGVFDGAIQAMQNICTMVLLTAAVKGMDVFMKRTFAL